jgi:hypothetical protein
LPFGDDSRKAPERTSPNHEEKEGVIMELLETNDPKSLLLKNLQSTGKALKMK